MGTDPSKQYQDNNEYGLNVIAIGDDTNINIKNNLEKIFTILINIPNPTFNYENNVPYDIPLIPNSKLYHYGAFLHEGNKQEQFDPLFSMIQTNVQTASTKTENNLLMVFVSNSDSKFPLELLHNISELYTHYQPLIMFLSEEDNIIDIKRKIDLDEVDYDRKMLSFISYSNLEEIRLTIYRSFCYYSQYHEIDSFVPVLFSNNLRQTLSISSSFVNTPKGIAHIIGKPFTHSINIMVVGRPGVGKSTLINAMLASRRCKESTGNCVTNQMRMFKHKDFNITMFDTPGFEDKKGVEVLKKIIDGYTSVNTNLNYNVHMVLFLVNSSSRTLLYGDEDFIRYAIDKKIPMLFVLTRCETEAKAKEAKLILEHDLNKIDISLGEKIFCVQLKNEKERKIVSFGFEELMNNIYEVLKACMNISSNYFLPNNQTMESIALKGHNYAKQLTSYVFGSNSNAKEYMNEFSLKWIIKSIGAGYGVNLNLKQVNAIYERYGGVMEKNGNSLMIECEKAIKEIMNEKGVVSLCKLIICEYNEGINDLLNLRNVQN